MRATIYFVPLIGLLIGISACSLTGNVGDDGNEGEGEGDAGEGEGESLVDINNVSFRVSDRGSCLAAEPTACGIYTAGFSLTNHGPTAIAKMTSWAFTLDEHTTTTDSIECATTPWTAASDESSSLIEVQLDYLGVGDTFGSRIRVPCGDGESFEGVEAPPSRPSAEGTATLTMHGLLQDGSAFEVSGSSEIQ
jgi:hypothetical protein